MRRSLPASFAATTRLIRQAFLSATARASADKRRAASSGASSTTSADARTSSGTPRGPVTPIARPSHVPLLRAARRTPNASASLESSPNATTVAGSELREKCLHRLAFATRGPGPEIDDESAPVVGEIVRRQVPLGVLDRRFDGGPGCQGVVRLANVERHRRALALDEEPGRVAEEDGDAIRETGRGLVRVLVAGGERGDDARRAGAARIRPALQTMITEIDDPAHAHPGRYIGRGPAGEDRDADAFGMGGCDTDEPAESALGERHDARGARVARRLRECAVEVCDNKEPPGPRRESERDGPCPARRSRSTGRRAHGVGASLTDRSIGPDDSPVGSGRGQGLTLTRGVIELSPTPTRNPVVPGDPAADGPAAAPSAEPSAFRRDGGLCGVGGGRRRW